MDPETDVIIIADHDTNDRATENGQTAAAEVQAKLKSLGIDCTALMPKEPKSDAGQRESVGEVAREEGGIQSN